MNIAKPRLELQPEAEPDPDFIEALAARYKSQIEELKQNKFSSFTSSFILSQSGIRNQILAPPSSEHPHGKPPR